MNVSPASPLVLNDSGVEHLEDCVSSALAAVSRFGRACPLPQCVVRQFAEYGPRAVSTPPHGNRPE